MKFAWRRLPFLCTRSPPTHVKPHHRCRPTQDCNPLMQWHWPESAAADGYCLACNQGEVLSPNGQCSEWPGAQPLRALWYVFVLLGVGPRLGCVRRGWDVCFACSRISRPRLSGCQCLRHAGETLLAADATYTHLAPPCIFCCNSMRFVPYGTKHIIYLHCETQTPLDMPGDDSQMRTPLVLLPIVLRSRLHADESPLCIL